MIKKLSLIVFIIFILICSNISVLASAYFYYPKEYNVTLKNINQSDIKKIELIYDSGYGFNYESDENNRSWIEDTDFGYKYKDYSDEEIIPTLSTKEIDEIAKSYNSKDTSSIKGYWIDSKAIKRNTLIRKFAIYENASIKYDNNEAIITYSSCTKNFERINEMYLRIEKNDGSIIYSNVIVSKNVGVTDEDSSKEEIEIAKSVQNKKAYFEADFSKADKYIKVVEKDQVEEDTTIVEPKQTYNLKNFWAMVILFILGLLL